jgi:hypothetical protein
MAIHAHIVARVRLRWLLLAGGALVACQGNTAGGRLAGDDKVVAVVNGTSITKYDVDRSATEAFGPELGQSLSAETEAKLLQSLVQSRAISQVREKELSALERAELEKRVAAYREQLLVKQYLGKYTAAAQVSDEAIRRYYESHKANFGGKQVKTYELITSSSELDPAQRSKTIAALDGAGEQRDWDAWVAGLLAAGQPVALRRGEDDAAMLDPRVRQMIAPLEVGQTTKPTLIDGRPYVLRVTAQRELPPRPLAQVREEIRKTLAPVQLRDAIKQTSTRVLQSAEVAYR